MKKSIIVFTLTLCFFALTAIFDTLQAQESAAVNIDSQTLNLVTVSGQSVQVNVTVNNVQCLWGWDIEDVKFNPQILNLTDVQEGPLLKTKGQTFFIWSSASKDQIASGDIPEISGVLSVDDDVSGSGVLVTLTFQVLSFGNSPITISATHLVAKAQGGSNSNSPIACTTVNGKVNIVHTTNSPYPSATLNPTPTHVSSVSPSSTANPSVTPSATLGGKTLAENTNLSTLLWVAVIAVIGLVILALVLVKRKRT